MSAAGAWAPFACLFKGQKDMNTQNQKKLNEALAYSFILALLAIRIRIKGLQDIIS